MEQWEYLPIFMEANAKEKTTREYVQSHSPNWEGKKKPPRYTPEAMMPKLNELGEQGWELVHMEPVADVGNKGDVLFEGNFRRWSNTYFCVFKRRHMTEVADDNGMQPSDAPLLPDLGEE